MSETIDIAALDRVQHRLVLTEDDRIEQVLSTLLPRLLPHLGNDSIRAKVLKILSHALKRIRAISFPKLPVLELRALTAGANSAYSRQFSALFLGYGVHDRYKTI